MVPRGSLVSAVSLRGGQVDHLRAVQAIGYPLQLVGDAFQRDQRARHLAQPLVVFGMNATHAAPGVIRVGDAVRVVAGEA